MRTVFSIRWLAFPGLNKKVYERGSPMRKLLTFAAYARHRNCSPAAVTQAVAAGRVSAVAGPDGRKMIDPEVADLQWKSKTDAAQSARANASKRVDDLPGTDPAGGDYFASRARRENAEANMAEMRAAELAGELVSAERVRLAASKMGRMVRDAVLGVPSRIAPTLASESDAHLIEQTLLASLRRALDDTARLTASDLEQLGEQSA
jgi:phage terminase Nu1 subunit (DNA packaging protein)